MIIFAGSRSKFSEFSTSVYFWLEGERPRDLPLTLEIVNHSPTGFEWGYGGSGPSQLALAIVYWTLALATAADEEEAEDIALRYYQGFKEQFVAKFPKEGWQISSETVLSWLDNKIRGNGLDTPKSVE